MADDEADTIEAEAAEPEPEPEDVPRWWESRGPIRELVFAYLRDRLRSLEVREAVDGPAMLPGWQRELKVLTAVKQLYDWLERQEMERQAEVDKRGRRR